MIPISPHLISHRTCTRMLRLVNDRSIWSIFDMSFVALTCRQLKLLLTIIPDAISAFTEFRVRGLVYDEDVSRQRIPTITPNMLRRLRENCPNLRVLEINEGFVDFRRVKSHISKKIFKTARLIQTFCDAFIRFHHFLPCCCCFFLFFLFFFCASPNKIDCIDKLPVDIARIDFPGLSHPAATFNTLIHPNR